MAEQEGYEEGSENEKVAEVSTEDRQAKSVEQPAPERATAEDMYVKNVMWQRKVVMDALYAVKSACLHNEQGYADTTPPVNLVNTTLYKGVSLLYLKEVQKQRGFPTGEFVTTDQIDKAGETQGKTVYKIKGEKGIVIPYKEQDKATG
jgi:hypothetical protein